MAERPRPQLLRRILVWGSPLIVALVALVVAGCSGNEDATTSTTTSTTAAPSTTTSTPPADRDPLQVAWVRQVGGPGDDVLNAATGRGDAVIGIGTTAGLTTMSRPGTGATAAFVDVVAASDGTQRATVQSTQAATVTGTAIASATSADRTIACGATAGASASAGTAHGWCATAGLDGALGAATVPGTDRSDTVAGVAVASDGNETYAVGSTDGLFPGAKDPTGGELGEGDALVTRIAPSGALSWARQFGSSAPDAATSVTTSDGGDAVIAGWTDGTTRADTTGAVGAGDAWIARMDPSGSQRWMTQYGSAGVDRALAVASGGDPRQGTETFVTAGSTDGAVAHSSNLGATDAIVHAFDASGRLRWSLQFGSTADDVATGVAVDGTTAYVTGTTAGKIIGGRQIALTPTAGPDGTTSSTAPGTTVPPTGGGLDGFLAAVDLATGELRWVAQFGTAGDERVTGVTRSSSGLLVVTGSTTGQLTASPAGGGTDGFMVAFALPSGGGGAARIV
ncbi:MAG: hypothetical protein JST64_07210 [Actinobacteria bacterium]|nr:hypothetical protein [Actinomycetota bacterium]